MRRLLIVCFSLANLSYLRIWKDLLVLPADVAFYNEHPPDPAQYLAAAGSVSLLAILFFVVSVALRKAPGWVRSLWFLFLIALIASSMRGLFAAQVPVLRGGLFHFLSPKLAFSLGLIILLASYYLIFRFTAQVARVGASVASILAPFVMVTFAESAFEAARSYDDPPDKTAARAASIPARRVVWIIFDELDYRLSFVARPASIRMPNLDRLCAQSLCASDAVPPSDATAVSMPDFIYGRLVRSEQIASADRMQLNFSDGSVAVFGSAPNIFSKARSAGFNTAVVGWYLPYCRALKESLTDCWWSPMENQQNSSGDSFGQALWLEPKSLFETPIYSLFGQSTVARAHAAAFRALLDRAKEKVTDPELGLTLVHLNVPHPPYFYNVQTGRADLANSRNGYGDALALVDQAWGELRVAMQDAGVWDRTTVLVSADHWLRSAREIDQRVPFLLHLAGDDRAAVYGQEFKTLLTGDLLLAILNGELKSNAAAADWITRASSGSQAIH